MVWMLGWMGWMGWGGALFGAELKRYGFFHWHNRQSPMTNKAEQEQTYFHNYKNHLRLNNPTLYFPP